MPSRSEAKPVIALRRPPKGPTAAVVEAFVTGDLDAQASERPGVRTAEEPPKGRSLVTRADGRVRRRRTVYLPPELDRRLAVHCAAEGVEASEVVAEALAAYLAG